MTGLLEHLVKPDKVIRMWRRSRRVRRLAKRPPRNVIVGASGAVQPGWIATDIEQLNLLRPRRWRKYFAENTVDALLAEHVWEHLTVEDGIRAAETCFRFLKPGGYLRVAVPDGFHPDAEYRERVRPGGSGPGADDHKVLYTCETFPRVFASAGFAKVKLLEYFDERGKFHFDAWNPEGGLIRRSSRFDARNADGTLRYTSLILDAHKAT